MDGLKISGAPSKEEVKNLVTFPPVQMRKDRNLVFIECLEEIPCNPCETACPQGAIHVGNPITNLPKVDFEKCIGCGICVSACPGQAIYLKKFLADDGKSTISFPFEYYPLPEKGMTVSLVGRHGEEICDGSVIAVQNSRKNDHTAVVTVLFDRAYFEDVISMRRL